MRNKSYDNFARSIAILSLIVAICAVAIPFFQQKTSQQIQQEQFSELQKESLSVQLNPYVGGEIRLTKINLGPMGHVVQVPWKLTISNTGNRQLSITEHFVTRGESPNSIQYSGIDGGLIDGSSLPVKYPVTYEPGESKIFYIFVGITVSQNIYDAILPLTEKGQLTDRLATKILGKQGIDIYGNKVEYTEFEDGSYTFQVKEKAKSQQFWLQLTTGRGNNFLATAKKYDPI